MATFCSKCGAQAEGNERFCSKCGNDLTAGAVPSAPGPVAVATPPPGYPAATSAGYAVPPQIPIPPPGRVPMSVAMPPPAPAKKSGILWLVVIVALAAGAYYYYKHTPQSLTPPASSPQLPPNAPQPGAVPPGAPAQPGGVPPQQPQGGPGQPGGNPAQPGGYPGQQPGGNPAQPGGYPGQQPGGNPQQPGGGPGGNPQQPGGAPGGGGNAALVQQQQFAGRWVPQNGNVEVENAQWKNSSAVPMQSATLECVQYAATGATIFQITTVLNGPAAPGATLSFGPFAMGAIQQGMARVQCGIVAVTPAQWGVKESGASRAE
jgi:hypothetical protein